MAKLTALPSMDIISGMKGVVDYYVWMGIPCARRWPRSPSSKRSLAVRTQWPAFSYSASAWRSLTPEVQALYVRMSASTSITGRDLFMKAYLSGLYAYPTGP